MAVYRCLLCGYEYDESTEEMSFESLPEDWVCPLCSATKDQFEKVD